MSSDIAVFGPTLPPAGGGPASSSLASTPVLPLDGEEPGGSTSPILPAASPGRLSVICWAYDPVDGLRRMGGEYAACESPAELRSGEAEPRPLARLFRRRPALAGRIEALWKGAEVLRFHELELVLDGDRLLVLGARPPAFSSRGALRVAVEEALAGRWRKQEAVAFLRLEQAEALERPAPRPAALSTLSLLAQGRGLAPGVAYGRAVYSVEAARRRGGERSRVVLFIPRAGAGEIDAVGAGGGIVAASGGVASWGARAARLRGLPMAGWAGVGGAVERCPEGSWVAVDGASGKVYLGEPRLAEQRPPPEMGTLLSWADAISARHGLHFRVNADTAAELRAGSARGARGVGLCRSERLLTGPEPLELLRRSVLAPSAPERLQALRHLGAAYRSSFRSLLSAAGGLPVTIRLLDPTLGELLPEEGEEVERLAHRLAMAPAELERAVRGYRSANPSLGFRGSRVGLVRPELYDMQLQALFEAACALQAAGRKVAPEVLFPFVSTPGEAVALRARVEAAARRVSSRRAVRLSYRVGAMVELPRAALLAGELARELDFLCLGTNDLTQTMLGVSREDVGGFLPGYLERGIWREDPFRVLDEGVAEIVGMAVRRARGARSDVDIGICGEHAGDPTSIRRLLGPGGACPGLDYLSCSAFRLPLARLAAAQALLEGKELRPAASRRSTRR